MIIIHDVNNFYMPRALAATVEARLRSAPVVVVTGARQTGKSTLVQRLRGAEGRAYFTLDDLDILEQAQREPDALLRDRLPLTLDEVQRAPDLLMAVKRAVDRERTPGRFLLTGSANLLLMRRVSETLAGRAQYLTLWPMARREQLGEGACGAWSLFFDEEPDVWADRLERAAATRADWRPLAARGGYPVPALRLEGDEARAAWFTGYVRTYLERDLQDLSAVGSLVDFRRLMTLAALRSGQLLNQSELGRDAGLSQPTVHRWLNLLEVSYQVVRLPAYAASRAKRVIKTPKLYLSDAGIALHLAGVAEPAGAHLETLILADLLQWREGRVRRPEILYWRTAGGREVDFLIELGRRLLPVEVKAGARVGPGDARHLEFFLDEHARLARAGLLVYAGAEVRWITGRVLAAPWWAVI